MVSAMHRRIALYIYNKKSCPGDYLLNFSVYFLKTSIVFGLQVTKDCQDILFITRLKRLLVICRKHFSVKLAPIAI
jgi:hypothetical protein